MSRVLPAMRPVTGSNAAAMKYDILSAIGLLGVHGTARDQASMPRLALLVTARYNWKRGEVSMGQSEMARLWGVSDRTAKREIKFWLDQGLLLCKRPGVRGRVASYQLNLGRILELSEPFWPAIGADYAERMVAESAPPDPERKVVPLRPRQPGEAAPLSDDPWSEVKGYLRREQPEVYSSWLADLTFARTGQGAVRVTAPSRFIASYVNGHYLSLIERALAATCPEVRQVSVTADQP